MFEPDAPRLLNDQDDEGAVLCPDCRKPIALSVGARFCEGYALHITCANCPVRPADADYRPTTAGRTCSGKGN